MEALAREQQGVRQEFERTGRSVGDLQGRLDRLGRTRSRPSVRLEGFDRVNAEIGQLERRLDLLQRRRIDLPFSNVAGGGGGGGVGSMAGFGGGGGGGGRSPTLFHTLGGLPGIGLGALGLSPGILALLGSATGLAGSATSAAVGAGTVGLGGYASLAAGLGLTVAVAKPAVSALADVTKAQQSYNQAVAEYGRRSSEAKTAAAQLNYTLAQNPLAAGATRQLGQFERQWSTATTAARTNVYGGISGVLANARRGVPAVGRDAGIATGATSNAAIAFSGFLTQAPQLATLGVLMHEFAQDVPVVERTLENVTSTVEHLAVAATPFFHESVLWVERWSAGLASSTADTDRVQGKMRGYVNSAKDWARLAGAAARDIRDIFEAGAPSGDSMVIELTQTLDRWDHWIDDNPQKVQRFFQQSKTTTEDIAGAVSGLLRDAAQLANYLDPIFARTMQLIHLASGLGGGNLALGGGLLYSVYQGVSRGRGPSAGGVARSFITGSPGGLLSFGGGAAVGAGGVAAASSLARRATNYEVATGRTASGAILLGSASEGPEAVLARRAAAAEAGWANSIRSLATRTPVLGRVADLGAGATRALGAVGRVALPLYLGMSVLQGVQSATSGGGSALSRINRGVSGTLSAGTLGIIPQSTFEQAFAGAPTGTSLHGDPYLQAGYTRIAHQASAVRTPAQLHAVASAVSHGLSRPGPLSEMAPQEQAQVIAFLNRALGTAVQNAGAQASNTWQDAFGRALDHGESPKRAVNTMLSGMEAEVHQLGPRGARAFASDAAQWVSQLEMDNPRLRKPLERLMQGVVGQINEMNDTTGDSFRDLQRKVFVFNGEILSGSQKTWQAIGTALTDPAQRAQEKLQGIFGAIQREAVNALVSMGFSGNDARALVTGLASGTVKAGTLGQAVQTRAGLQAAGVKGASGIVTGAVQLGASGYRHALGGRIPGLGSADTVRLADGSLGAPGELIVNGWTERDVNRDLALAGKRSLGARVAGETRPHYVRRAVGGRMVGSQVLLEPGVNMSVGQEPQILQALRGFSSEEGMPVYVISGYRSPAHSVAVGGFADDPHTRGQAADIGLGAPSLASMMGVPESALRAVGLWRPFYPASAHEVNHVQLLSGGARGAAGMIATAMGLNALRAPRSGLGGVPGALADRAGLAFAAGMTARINQTLAAAGGGASFAGVPGAGGDPTGNRALGRAMMLALGWGPDQWPSLDALWTQESGWNDKARNPSSGAAGIPQDITGNMHGGARGQIAWGLNYIHGRYGSPAGAEAHERRFNWYRHGTDQIVTRPTVFGAGENGPERVKITPLGRGSGGVSIGRVNVNVTGGISERRVLKLLDRRLLQFARDVADEIEIGDETSHHEYMG